MIHPNDHVPSYQDRQRVKDMAFTGIPKDTIARVMGICTETLVNHYQKELANSEADMLTAIANKASIMALEGNEKMISLVLKTKAAKHGWQEKQVIETTDTKDTQALHDKIAELERINAKDY